MRNTPRSARALVVVAGGLAIGWTAGGTTAWSVSVPAVDAAQVAPAAPPPSTQKPAVPTAPADDPIVFACPVRGPFGVRETYHSQFYEDYVLSYVFKDVATGSYVDVGASDPDIGSVTKYFYLRGWRGVNIEPNPEHQVALRKARPDDANVEVGISDTSATLQFYRFEARATGLSTFDRDTALRHRAAGFQFDELSIPVTTLSDVLQKNERVTGAFSFLNVDVEGFERKVLSGLDFRRFPPTVVMIEATAPLTEDPTHQNWESLLYEAGYLFALDDGLNRYYLHPSQRSLLQRFIEVNYCMARDKVAKRIKLDGFMPEPTP
jgi:FkbM family methyltransferase